MANVLDNIIIRDSATTNNLTATGSSALNGTTFFGGYGPGSGPGLAVENLSTFTRFAFWGLDFYDWNNGIQMRIDNSQVSANNSFRAPIFYDVDDTAYYIDPNSSSRILRLNVSENQVNAANNAGGRVRVSSFSNGASEISNDTYNILLGPAGTRTGTGYYAGIAINGLMNYLGSTAYDVAPHIWIGAQYRDTPGSERSDFVVAVKSGTGLTGTGADLPQERFRVDYEGIATATGSMRAPVFFDSNDTGYYLDPSSVSRIRGLSIAGNASDQSTIDQIGFWAVVDGVPNTTSAIGFKKVGGVWAEHGATSEGYNTYFTMDTTNRGWIFRRATVGGSNYTGVNVASISNTGIAQFDGSARAPIFYDSDDTGYFLDPLASGTSLKIAGNIYSIGAFGSDGYSSSSPNAVSRVFSPKGGAFSSDGSTGAIRIKLPFRANNAMWQMKVRIYNYSTNQTSEYLLGNYAYDQGGYHSSATFIGGQNAGAHVVRFGNEDGVDCVWIGETGTSWSYPVVSVLDFTSGFRTANAASMAANWNIAIVSSFGTVQTTISPNIRLYNAYANTFIADGSVSAPIFYDSNNTGYYIDAASTSNLNALNVGGHAVITAGNIGSQSVSYANTAGSANGVVWGNISSLPGLWYQSGSWYADFGSYSFVRENGVTMSGGAEFVLMSRSGQGHVLIDGSYWAGEGSGFYSLNGGNQYTSQVGFARDGNAFAAFNTTVSAVNDVRAPIFYDSNDTTYYTDPNSTSRLRDLWVRGDNQYEGYVMVGGDSAGARLNINFDQMWTNVGNLHLQYSSSGNIDMNQGGGYTFSRTSLRAPIFYDYNDTGYYVDPASTSNLNGLNVGGNAVITAGNIGSQSVANADTVDSLHASTFYRNIGFGSGYPSWNLDTVDADRSGFTYANAAPYTGPFIHIGASGYGLQLNAPYSSGGFGLSFRTRNGDTGSWNGWKFPAVYGINANGGGALYSTIYYDQDNTGYYVDPASTSSLSGLTVASQISGSISGASNAIANTGYGNGNFTWKQDYNTFGPYSGWHNYLISNHGDGSNYYNTIIAMPFWGTPRYSRLEGGTQRGPYEFWVSEAVINSQYDVNAPIFYDYNDTGYYLNPAGFSNLGRIKFNDVVSSGAPVGDAVVGRNYAYNTLELKGYGSEMMIGAQGTDIHINYRYCNNTGNNTYTPQNWYWRNGTSVGWSDHYWGTGQAASSLRAPIFYDSNNTTYYTDPASTSYINGLNVAGQTWRGDITWNTGVNINVSGESSFDILGASGIWQVWTAANSLPSIYVTYSGQTQIGQAGNRGLYVYGAITASADITAYSDARVKKNVKTIDNALDKVLNSRGVYYNRTDSDDTKTKIGVIAQEILEVIPEVVLENEDGMYSVSYGNITAVLIEAIKEQQKQIEELKAIVNGITK